MDDSQSIVCVPVMENGQSLPYLIQYVEHLSRQTDNTTLITHSYTVRQIRVKDEDKIQCWCNMRNNSANCTDNMNYTIQYLTREHLTGIHQFFNNDKRFRLLQPIREEDIKAMHGSSMCDDCWMAGGFVSLNADFGTMKEPRHTYHCTHHYELRPSTPDDAMLASAAAADAAAEVMDIGDARSSSRQYEGITRL